MALTPEDLIPVARLSYHEEDGEWLRWSADSNAATDPEDLDQVFLFFAQKKVWYVTIAETKTEPGRKWVRFVEEDVLPEIKNRGWVSVMLAPDEETDEEPPLPDLEGRPVFFEDRQCGTVTDYFHNGAQWVIVCETVDGGELLIPFVDWFIASTEDGRILLQNARELIATCESTS